MAETKIESQLSNSQVGLDYFNSCAYSIDSQFAKVGKKRAGALIDGKVYREVPE